MQSSSQGRHVYPRYQGYPYVNPVVHDVPSIDAQTASRWTNLPRRPLQDGPSVASAGSSSGASSSQTAVRVVESSSQQHAYTRYQGYPYVNPVYNDVSGSAGPSRGAGGSTSSLASGASSQAAARPQTPGNSDSVPPKKDLDENPVVYIDLPEAGSEVSRSIVTPEDEEPEFVQNTIMYDPFENRRIDMPKEEERAVASSSEAGSSSYTPQYQNARPVPIRPNTLDIASGSGSGTQSPASSSRQTPIVPNFMSKESQVYGTDGADGFPLSPIPISEFPEPPPAYTEVDETPRPREVVREPPRVVEPPPPPRTQVIVNDQASPVTPMPIIGLQRFEQKNLLCHHCGHRVHTIVQKECGAMTHFIACMVFFIFLPFVLIVYLLDYFKYKNHYCPNCFKLIGYETPIVGQKVNYVT